MNLNLTQIDKRYSNMNLSFLIVNRLFAMFLPKKFGSNGLYIYIINQELFSIKVIVGLLLNDCSVQWSEQIKSKGAEKLTNVS